MKHAGIGTALNIVHVYWVDLKVLMSSGGRWGKRGSSITIFHTRMHTHTHHYVQNQHDQEQALFS